MTSVYISPFDHIKAIHWSKKTWCLGEYGEFIGVEPDDGDQTNIGLTLSPATAGLAVHGRYVYTLFFGGPPQKIVEHDIEAGGNADFITAIGFDDADDVATDGEFLYVSGADTSDGSTNVRVSKFQLFDGTKMWTKDLGNYGGSGAINVVANPGGFMVCQEPTCKFYDGDGVLLGTYSTLADVEEYSLCATRDRFFVQHKDSLTSSGVSEIKCLDGSGNHQWTITTPNVPVGTNSMMISATERYIFAWRSLLGVSDIANNKCIVIPRAVTRDANGNILTDVPDPGSSVVYDLGTQIDNLDKATVDATTFTVY